MKKLQLLITLGVSLLGLVACSKADDDFGLLDLIEVELASSVEAAIEVLGEPDHSEITPFGRQVLFWENENYTYEIHFASRDEKDEDEITFIYKRSNLVNEVTIETLDLIKEGMHFSEVYEAFGYQVPVSVVARINVGLNPLEIVEDMGELVLDMRVRWINDRDEAISLTFVDDVVYNFSYTPTLRELYN